MYNKHMLRITDYKPGMTVYGMITGVQPYGAFVVFEGGVKGLIHISELSERYVRNVGNYVNVGDHLLVKVIDVDVANKQLRLSLKAVDQNMRKARRKAKFLGLPPDDIGFASLAQHLEGWIRQGGDNALRSE